MARAGLGWSQDELAKVAKISWRTVKRFEDDLTVSPASVAAIGAALEREGVQFIASGSYRGGVVPPMEGR